MKVLMLLCGAVTSAAETDNFTGRNAELVRLPDSLAALDEFTNQRLRQAVDQANQKGSCDRRPLYLEVWNALGRNPIGQVERFAEDPRNIKNHLMDFDKGIYGGVPTFLDEYRTPRFADLFILTGWFDPTIRLDGQVIGIDKLGHFFGQGWEYFQSQDLKEAFKLGDEQECGMDGYIGSGVYSYGDLSANFSGLSFWRNLVGTPKAYVTCEAGRFVQARKFSWKEYVSPSWDEALNCSKYVSAEMERSINERIRGQGLSCPVEPKACAEMVKPVCSNHTVSPSCFKIAGVSLEQKAAECEAYLQGQRWHAPTLSRFDRWSIGLDSLTGVMGMPVHFLLRRLVSVQ